VRLLAILVAPVLLLAALGEAAPARHVRRRTPVVMTMKATAFTRAQQPTASGTEVHEGVAAADPRILPLGTRIRVTGAGPYSGNYLVADTGSAIKGRHIDLWVPSASAARRFGSRLVRVRIRRVGTGKE